MAIMTSEQAAEVMDLAHMPASGTHILKDLKATPKEGKIADIELKLPPFTKASYFSQDDAVAWPAGTNRVLPWAVGDDLSALSDNKTGHNPATTPLITRGMMATFKLASGDYLTLLPFCSNQALSTLDIEGRTDTLSLDVYTFGTAEVSGDLPVLSWGLDKDLYRSNRLAWEHAIETAGGATDWRMNKHYPEPFKYLGWCSWEEYKKDIDSDLMVNAAKGIEESGVPVRWYRADDGYQIEEDLQLKSFKPDPKTFPQGWDPLLAYRKEDKIKWFGLWHCFTGLWGGICKENDFGEELNNTFVPIVKNNKDALAPGKTREGAELFYDACIKSVEDEGFDFAMMDNQSAYIGNVEGEHNPVTMNSWAQQALETACKKRMNGLINCMAHNSANLFNTRHSAVTRCSIDYEVGNDAKAKSHLMQSYHNSLWLGQTVWPDHDMFHSSDKYSGQMMAVSNALSGGPIYLSDDPKNFRKDFIAPLAYEDGELLRPLAPAVPLPESLFFNVFSTPEAYRVIAPLANNCAAIAAYNLNHPNRGQKKTETTVTAEITPADYAHASGMLQPATEPWEVPAEGLVIYDWYKGTGEALTDSYKVDLKGFTDALLLLSAVENGWAVIGAANRYLSGAAVSNIKATGDKLEVEMVESLPLVVYSKTGKVTADGHEVSDLGNGFWRVELPVGQRGARVTVSRPVTNDGD
jgi:macrodomain Ter protein organizer (MatP/YcbG family)